MDYIIIKENKIDYQKIKHLENIEIPYIPIEINEMFTKDYKFMKKLLDYKRDATLALLKIYDAINIYDDNFNLKVEKEIKNWYEIFHLLKNYEKIFTSEGLNFYNNKQTHQLNIIFQIMDEKFLGSIIKQIFQQIYQSYLKKFNYWPNPNGEQKDFINIDLKKSIVIKKIKYYWHFQGIILVKDINYGKFINGNFFKVEFNGNPKLQIVRIDLNILEYLRKNEQNLKQYIDMIDDKIIAKKMQTLNLDLDF